MADLNSGLVIGIILCLFGNLSMNLGTNIVKVAHNKRERKLLENEDVELKPLWKSKLWVCGAVVFKSGNVLNFVAYGLGPQSVLAAMSGIQFVSNTIFARIFLKEKTTPVMLVGIAGIIGGIITLVLLFDAQKSQTYDHDDLVALFTEPAYLLYMLTIFSGAAGCFMYVRHQKGKPLLPCCGYATRSFTSLQEDYAPAMRDSKEGSEATLSDRPAGLTKSASADSSGSDFKVQEHDTLSTDLPSERSRTSKASEVNSNRTSADKLKNNLLIPFCFAFYSAVPGTQSVTFSKMCSSLLRETINGDNQLIYPFTYFCILVFVVAGILWDKQLNQGLRKFDALIITPVMQSNFTLFAIVNGGIYFQEFYGLSGAQIGGMIGAITVVVGSMFLLVPNAEAKSSESVESLQDLNLLTLDQQWKMSDLDPNLKGQEMQDVATSPVRGLGAHGLGNNSDDAPPPLLNTLPTPIHGVSKTPPVKLKIDTNDLMNGDPWDCSTPRTPDATSLAVRGREILAAAMKQHEIAVTVRNTSLRFQEQERKRANSQSSAAMLMSTATFAVPTLSNKVQEEPLPFALRLCTAGEIMESFVGDLMEEWDETTESLESCIARNAATQKKSTKGNNSSRDRGKNPHRDSI